MLVKARQQRSFLSFFLLFSVVDGLARSKGRQGGGLGLGSSSSLQAQGEFSPREFHYTRDESSAIRGMIDLLLDFECEGIDPDGGIVEVGFSPDGMRGVFCREQVAEGEFVMAVPFPSTLLIMDDEPNSMTDADRGLLLMRKYLDHSETSEWLPYLDSLPTMDYCFDPTPDFWSLDEIHSLEFPRIIKEALSRKEEIRRLSETEGVDCKQLQFATWMAKSRCFTTIKVKKGGNQLQSKSVLIPFIDMINHSSDEANAVLQVIETKEEDESFYAIQAIRPIAEGEQVLLSYGTTADSSVELLMNYGLVQNSNQYDAEMLRQCGDDCISRIEDWSTSLQEDEIELENAIGTRKTVLAFRSRLKRAICEM